MLAVTVLITFGLAAMAIGIYVLGRRPQEYPPQRRVIYPEHGALNRQRLTTLAACARPVQLKKSKDLRTAA